MARLASLLITIFFSYYTYFKILSIVISQETKAGMIIKLFMSRHISHNVPRLDVNNASDSITKFYCMS